MAIDKKIGSIKRFGARYGRGVKHKVGQIEALKKSSTKCPYCNADAVKRISAGIWNCGKCSSKFSGKAYTFNAKTVVQEALPQEEEPIEEPVEEKEDNDKKEETVVYKEKDFKATIEEVQ